MAGFFYAGFGAGIQDGVCHGDHSGQTRLFTSGNQSSGNGKPSGVGRYHQAKAGGMLALLVMLLVLVMVVVFVVWGGGAVIFVVVVVDVFYVRLIILITIIMISIFFTKQSQVMAKFIVYFKYKRKKFSKVMIDDSDENVFRPRPRSHALKYLSLS